MQYIIGIGVQKAATSWLHSVLSSHPEINGSSPKEVDFFSYYYDRGYAWYKSHFVGKARTRLEISPSYFLDPRAPDRLKKFAPNAKVILMLRDPVERAFSGHLHEIIKGHIKPCGFFDAHDNNPMYIEQSLYAKHLVNWLEVFPPSQIQIIYQENLGKNQKDVIQALYKFAGVAGDFEPPILLEHRNVSDLAKSPKLRAMLRFIGDNLRKVNLEKQLSKIKKLPPFRQLLQVNSIDVRTQIPALSDEERTKLSAYFYEDQIKLKALIKKHNLELKH